MDAPVIAAVNGTAAGGGFSLMCGCDLVLAVASASFTMAYTKAGLSPDGSSTFYLARLIGLRRAYEMARTNRVLSAAEALEWGSSTASSRTRICRRKPTPWRSSLLRDPRPPSA